MNQSKSTESLILTAAQKIFMKRGYQAARMQEIADDAGINKALLHYYFRSKERLFLHVFRTILQKVLIPKLASVFTTDGDFESMVQGIIESYTSVLDANPGFPPFLITEINRNPEQIIELIPFDKLPIQEIRRRLAEEIKAERIRDISYQEFLINLLSLTIFPYLIQKITAHFLFENEEEQIAFSKNRAENLSAFFLSALRT